MTPRRPVRTVLAIARGTAPTRARGAQSAARLGASFEDTVEAVWALHGHAMRGQAVTKVVRSPQGPKVVHTKKNGVDFVGVLHGRAVALECKRLPGAASLRGTKDDSTVAEARWLLAFAAQGGVAAFLVHDPDAARVYLVADRRNVEDIACGKSVLLRTRTGVAVVAWYNAMDVADAVSCALHEVVGS